MWYGEYLHSLDAKDRFILPAKFREKIKQLPNKTFFITRGLDGCLFIFTHDVWKVLEGKLKEFSFTKQQARSFNRIYFSGAAEVEFDAQGRMTLPGYLKEFAAIKKEIVIIGVSDRIEIWDKDKWRSFYADNREKFDGIAEGLIE
ncbi:MAG: division/cell wall cluster transcriptional repressor MraZ [Candidatus Omnitrophota bacterium]